MSVFSNSEEPVIVEEVVEEVDFLGNYNRSSAENSGGESNSADPAISGGGGSSSSSSGGGGGGNMEAEKRIRREIANSNERRRMQSINAGFQSLRTLLPHHEGEKLSKAAILQQTAEYIYSLEQEKTRLLSQNCQLKRLVNQHEGGEVPPKKRIKVDTSVLITAESSDEGVGSLSPEPVALVSVVNTSQQQTELMDVRRQLEQERRLRMMLEDQIRSLESQVVYSYTTPDETAGVVVSLDELHVVGPDTVPAVAQTQTVVAAPPSPPPPPPPRSPSPVPTPRLPSALEAAIKAEPKVEVERLPETGADGEPQARLYVANTSRQNLETIVEAIRHLEGDHLFGEAPGQDAPLALTTKPADTVRHQRLLQVEMNPFLQFHSTAAIQRQQQQRPGVIVVKHS